MVDKDIFKELEKLAPEERIKRLQDIEEEIEKEKNEQMKAAKELIEKSNIEIEKESEEERLEKLFEHVKVDDNLEDAVKKEEPDSIEGHVQYAVVGNQVDEQVAQVNDGYKRNDEVMYKKEDVGGSYNSGVVDSAKETWKAMGYEKPKFGR